ncbi:MAG: hypothetical protein WED05_10475 [Candidatus Atabeyarchaeum deiterrae]
MGRASGKTKIVAAILVVMVASIMGYLVLAYPSAVLNESGTLSGVASHTYPFSILFPKSSAQIVFTCSGTGLYRIIVRDNAGSIVFDSTTFSVPSTNTTGYSSWFSAFGAHTVQVSGTAMMTYTLTVMAKGFPW